MEYAVSRLRPVRNAKAPLPRALIHKAVGMDVDPLRAVFCPADHHQLSRLDVPELYDGYRPSRTIATQSCGLSSARTTGRRCDNTPGNSVVAW